MYKNNANIILTTRYFLQNSSSTLFSLSHFPKIISKNYQAIETNKSNSGIILTYPAFSIRNLFCFQQSTTTAFSK